MRITAGAVHAASAPVGSYKSFDHVDLVALLSWRPPPSLALTLYLLFLEGVTNVTLGRYLSTT